MATHVEALMDSEEAASPSFLARLKSARDSVLGASGSMGRIVSAEYVCRCTQSPWSSCALMTIGKPAHDGRASQSAKFALLSLSAATSCLDLGPMLESGSGSPSDAASYST